MLCSLAKVLGSGVGRLVRRRLRLSWLRPRRRGSAGRRASGQVASLGLAGAGSGPQRLAHVCPGQATVPDPEALQGALGAAFADASIAPGVLARRRTANRARTLRLERQVELAGGRAGPVVMLPSQILDALRPIPWTARPRGFCGHRMRRRSTSPASACPGSGMSSAFRCERGGPPRGWMVCLVASRRAAGHSNIDAGEALSSWRKQPAERLQ